MAKSDRIANKVLLKGALAVMRENGKPLINRPSRGRAMLYSMPNDESVRVRTSNDHKLIVTADKPTEGARLNIEGTDWLLIVIPEIERTPGKLIVYLVPTGDAVDAVRESHGDWLASNPNTKGNNTTWNLWFDRSYTGRANRHKKHGYAVKWEEYRLQSDITTDDIANSSDDAAGETGESKPRSRPPDNA